MARDYLEPGEYRDLLAGFKNPLEAYAVIMRESKGKIRAVNINRDGSRDRGIFQINDKAHPDVSDDCAFNPQCAVRAALRISKNGTDWGPWASSGSVHPNTNGLKLPKTDADDAGLFGIGRGPGLDTVAGDAVGSVAEVLTKFFKLVTSTEFWLRFGAGIAGIVLVVLGLKSLTGIDPPIPVSKIAKAVT